MIFKRFCQIPWSLLVYDAGINTWGSGRDGRLVKYVGETNVCANLFAHEKYYTWTSILKRKNQGWKYIIMLENAQLYKPTKLILGCFL